MTENANTIMTEKTDCLSEPEHTYSQKLMEALSEDLSNAPSYSSVEELVEALSSLDYGKSKDHC